MERHMVLWQHFYFGGNARKHLYCRENLINGCTVIIALELRERWGSLMDWVTKGTGVYPSYELTAVG